MASAGDCPQRIVPQHGWTALPGRATGAVQDWPWGAGTSPSTGFPPHNEHLVRHLAGQDGIFPDGTSEVAEGVQFVRRRSQRSMWQAFGGWVGVGSSVNEPGFDGGRGRAKHAGLTRVLAVVAVLAVIATILVFGEPNQPATATVVRPIVTVHALCTQPTIIDVAAGEPTRGLSAIDTLLGIDEPLISEAARDVSIVDTDVGTFFVLIRDAELRYALLRPTGLPVLTALGDDDPQTFRVLELPPGLEAHEHLVIGGEDEVFVVFAGADESMAAIRLNLATFTAEGMELNVGQAPAGVELADPAARSGSAVVHARRLWVVTNDGVPWIYDPERDPGQGWMPLDDPDLGPISGSVLVSDDDLIYGLFARDQGVELRGFTAPGSEPVPVALSDPRITAVAASFPGSRHPGWLVRGDDQRTGLLTVTDGGGSLMWIDDADNALQTAVGVVLHEQAAAILTEVDGHLVYHVIDGAGGLAGTFKRDPDDEDCTRPGAWFDAAAIAGPMSAGPLLHLHDPSGQFDCIIDTRDGLDDLASDCAPAGRWALDKGAAPESDFIIEIERAVAEFRDDEPSSVEPLDGDGADDGEPERLEDELADVGLGIQEVDEDLSDVCDDELVTEVVAPRLDGLAMGESAIRVDWSWSGGRCLPDRYLIEMCVIGAVNTRCEHHRTVEVHDRDGASNRLSHVVTAQPGRTYQVSVIAVKKGVTSAPSGVLSVTTPPAAPDAPSNVVAALADGVWTVSWTSCLDDLTCLQRPEAFVVTVEGCDGEALPRQMQTVEETQRSITYDFSGPSSADANLVGRNVAFTVASMAAGNSSEAVVAGPCTGSVRSGVSVTASNSPVGLALSGHTTTMTLELAGGRGLAQLFGTGSYDEISARLIHGGSSTRPRPITPGVSTSFPVDRCEEGDWTVELTPKRDGNPLSTHAARITKVRAACDWAVTESARAQVRVIGGHPEAITAEVTIPRLSADVEYGLVAHVNAEVACRWWSGGTSTPAVSVGDIKGDRVLFTIETPAVFDLEDACSLRPRIHGTNGEQITLPSRPLDLRPASGGVVGRLGPDVVTALKAAITARYGQRGDRPVVALTVDRGGLGCQIDHEAGSSRWTLELAGGRDPSCHRDVHRMHFDERDLRSGHALLLFRLSLHGGETFSVTESIPICELPAGPTVQPCLWQSPPQQPAHRCASDPSLPADHRNCGTSRTKDHDPEVNDDHEEPDNSEDPDGDGAGGDPPDEDRPGDGDGTEDPGGIAPGGDLGEDGDGDVDQDGTGTTVAPDLERSRQRG